MDKKANLKRLLHKTSKAKGISDLSDHLKREKMLKVQKQMKRSFGHKRATLRADVNARDALIEAIMEACSKPHKKKKFRFKQ